MLANAFVGIVVWSEAWNAKDMHSFVSGLGVSVTGEHWLLQNQLALKGHLSYFYVEL